MKLLTFLAERFAWRAHAPILTDRVELPSPQEARDCVVAFVHAEKRDEDPIARAKTLKQAQKHIEWLARKRECRAVVLHSFTHLGGESSTPAFGEAWIVELADKLGQRGYRVSTTPFGFTCAWDLSVHGESIAKVWKELGAGDSGAE